MTHQFRFSRQYINHAFPLHFLFYSPEVTADILVTFLILLVWR